MSSSILNLFLQGDGMSGACSGSITSWLCIAVPQSSAHFPTFKSWLIRSKCQARLRSEKAWMPTAPCVPRWSVIGRLAKVRVKTESPIDIMTELHCDVTRNS